MLNDLSPYPERSARLAQTLYELDATPEEIAEWTPVVQQLTRWPERQVTPADTRRLLAALAPAMPVVPVMPTAPVISPERQAVQVHQRLHPLWQLASMARTQVSILQPAFWLASLIIMLLGVSVELSASNQDSALLLQALGPLLACLSITCAFRSVGVRMLEFELGCPPSALQLIVARLVIVLGYDTALELVVSAVSAFAGSGGFFALTLHWLMPLLLVSGLALILSLWLSASYASGIAYGLWLAALAIHASVLQSQGLPLSAVPVTAEYLIGAVGLALLIAGALSFPARLQRLLPK